MTLTREVGVMRFRAIQRVTCAGLLGLGVSALAFSPAAAQSWSYDYYGRPVYGGPRYAEPIYGRGYFIGRPPGPRSFDNRLSQRMVMIAARDGGIQAVERIRDAGDVFIVDGIDRQGTRYRATLDAYDGMMLDRRRLPDPRFAEPARPSPQRRSTATLSEPQAPPEPKPAAPSARPEPRLPAMTPPAARIEPVKPLPVTPPAAAKPANEPVKPAAAVPAPVKPAETAPPAPPKAAANPVDAKPSATKPADVPATPKVAKQAGSSGEDDVGKAMEASKAWAVPVPPAPNNP